MLILSPWLWIDDEGGGAWGPPAGCRGSIDLTSLAQISEARPGQPRGWGLFLCGEILQSLADLGGLILSTEDLRDARPDARLLDAWEATLGRRPQGDTLAELVWDQLTQGADPANLDSNGLLVPGVDGRLRLWLGGLVRDEPFVFGEHPHSAKLRDLLQRQLDQVRQAALNGALIDPRRGVPDIAYHLKVADAIVEKYAGTNPVRKADLFARLKPRGWSVREGLEAHATTIAESFDTADGDTLGPDLSWTELTANAWEVFSSAARNKLSGSSCRARANSDLSSTDHYAQADITAHGSTGSATRGVGVMARKDGTTVLNHYLAWRKENSGSLQLFETSAGVRTQIGSDGAISVSLPDTIRLECNGSTISGWWNGSQIVTATDVVLSGQLRCGLFALTNTTFAQLDDFEAGDLMAAGVSYPRIERGVRGLNRGICPGMR